MNVPSSSKPEEFKLKDIEVLVDAKEQPWFKRANVGNVLGTRRISTSDAKLDQDDKQTRAPVQAEPIPYTMVSWSRPKDQQNSMDNFLSLTGTFYDIVHSQKN